MNHLKIFLSGSSPLLIFLFLTPLSAKSPGTTAGLALLHTSGARASALGDAFTAMPNDIQSLEFNPGSLGTLEQEHISLQYQSGLANDAFSKASLGWRLPKGAMGFSIGQYDSGTVKLFDGVNTKTVTAEKDLLMNIGYGSSIGKATLGANIRYLSSRLAETYGDNAYSVEAGAQIPLTKNIRFGLSGPLVQTKIQYANVKEDLPMVYRAGVMTNVNLDLATGRQPITLLVDAPYDANAHRLSLGGGVETYFGPLSLRAGSSGAMDVRNFSFGAGFAISNFTIDYTFGLIENGLNSRHNINFSMRFGNDKNTAQVQTPVNSEDVRQATLFASPEKSFPFK